MKARDNPFSAERIDALPYLPVEESLQFLVRRLAALAYRAAIIGPHGSGKTTLLDQLARDLRLNGLRPHRILLNDAQRLLPPLPALNDSDILLLDGAEQLSNLQWMRFHRRTQHFKLIITSHSSGLLPPLITTRTTLQLLEEIIARLINPVPSSLQARLPALFERFSGNIRDVLRHLYDEYAGRSVTPAAAPRSVHVRP